LTRHELKEQLQHDHFTDAVSDVLSYALSNRERLIRWIVIAVVVVILAGGALWFASYKRSIRQKALAAALHVIESPFGSSPQLPNSYPNQDAKQRAEIKALSDLVSKYGGTREGLIAQYYLGTIKVQRKDSKGAESDLRAVADSGSDFASLAKIALAQLYAGENRISEAQALLRSIANKPSDLVSKAQADILLAQLNLTTNPQETKRILQSLKTPDEPPAVSRAVDQISGQLTR
jgi:predicted negative regulator of RcsB-dependent stress response